ncbi:SGNH/GDSL hydrolase family protein [Corynebacteriaceae bacterium 6-324]
MKKILSVPAAITIMAAGALVSCSTDSADNDSSPASSTSQEATTEAETPRTYQEYVALGDSYSAMGSRAAETTGPAECFRSADNYPTLVAQDERIENFLDATCASAVTVNILTTRAGTDGPISAQLESLTEDTDLVTISIGGNDIGFPAIAGCFQEAMAAGVESDCAPQFNRDEMTSSVNEMLFSVYSSVQQRSPEARIVVTGYMPLITDEGQCEDAAFISDSDRGWAVGLTNEINGRIEGISSEMQIRFILPDGAYEHTVCAAPEERWTDLTGAETGGYPMHPTALGQEVMADAIRASL